MHAKLKEKNNQCVFEGHCCMALPGMLPGAVPSCSIMAMREISSGTKKCFAFKRL